VLSGEHPPYLGLPYRVRGLDELDGRLFGDFRVVRLVRELYEDFRVLYERAYPAESVDAGGQLGLPFGELLRLFGVRPDGRVREPRLQFVQFVDLCSLVKESSAGPRIWP